MALRIPIFLLRTAPRDMMAGVMRLQLVSLALVLGFAESGRASPILEGAVTDARLCDDDECDTVTMTLASAFQLLGFFSLDPALQRIEFDLELPSASLKPSSDGQWRGLLDARFQGTAVLEVGRGIALVSATMTPLPAPHVGSRTPFSALPNVDASCHMQSVSTSNCTLVLQPFAIPFDNGTSYLTMTLNVTVPEPEAVLFLSVGLIILGCAQRSRY